ncbi:unnamed protein product [Pleuronectes platessa]|uniref:Uncharacterized protein n=1 Tax=Pleuronectes platessa TaxID=8262 RepID=A0A9N7UDE9_PLEPL|nr:unnamed protein product [Pleuronectes platessa]
MKWLASVRAVFAGGSRSAPLTPAASPVIPSKADLHFKQLDSILLYWCVSTVVPFERLRRLLLFTRRCRLAERSLVVTPSCARLLFPCAD